MKKTTWTAKMLSYLLLAVGSALLGSAFLSYGQSQEKDNVLFIKFKDTAVQQLRVQELGDIVLTGIPSIDTLNRKFRIKQFQPMSAQSGKRREKHRQFGLHRWHKVVFPEMTEASSLATFYKSDPHIEAVQLQRKIDLIENIPDDYYFPTQWNLYQIGLPGAWRFTTGDSGVVVAVLDSGIDLNHADLKPNIWRNPGEIPENGLDDDRRRHRLFRFRRGG